VKALESMLVVILIVALDGQASAQEFPLFTAFKSFCVNTGGAPDAIRPAVEMAGGKPFKSASSDSPHPMTTQSWSITIDGHKMMVSAGTSRRPYSQGRIFEAYDCTINSFADEESSIAKIQEWAGVSPDSSSSAESIYYDYQEQKDVRSPMPADKAARESIMAAGHAWTLVVRRPARDFASVQLMHSALANAKPGPGLPPPPTEEKTKLRHGRERG
jgi:hypothetical protein